MEMAFVKYSWFIALFRYLFDLINGYLIYQIFVHYVRPREKLFCKIMLFCALVVCNGMVIWIGDHNLILTFPAYTLVTMLCTEGYRFGRLSVIFTFFCMVMSVCALLDTWLDFRYPYFPHDELKSMVYPGFGRFLIFASAFFFLKRKLPKEIAFLPERLWKVIFWLSLLPLCTLIAISFLTYGRYFSYIANIQAMYLCFSILPFIFLTSFAILAVISALADYEKLEKAKQLSELRENYYQNLRQHENSLRQMRHDMKNHLITVRSLLAERKATEAAGYLDALMGEVQTAHKDMDGCETTNNSLPRSAFLQEMRRFCENDAANALLQSKVELLLQNGLDYDFWIHLEEGIAISDIDLCSLIGNALDNAIRAAAAAPDKTITLRCRCDKGIFMLKVENCFHGKIDPELNTTKADRGRHGFGISGMREIAARYGGSLETQVEGNRFTLLVYLENL